MPKTITKTVLTPGARCMLRLKRRGLIVFAETDHREMLLNIRKRDVRLKYGRITSVLQCNPSAVTEGTVYDTHRRLPIGWRL